MKIAIQWIMLVVFSFMLFGVCSCFYSFRGTSVPPHMKTIAIPTFDDQSGAGVSGLRERVTQSLIQLFTTDNTLRVAERANADAVLEGSVTSVQDQAASVSPGEQVRRMQVTVIIHASFYDVKLRKKVWERDFSNMGIYDSGGLSKRDAGITDAIRKISDDVLNATVSGW